MRILFSLFVAFLSTTALWAYDFQSGDLYYNITSSVEPYTVEVTSQLNSYPYNEGVVITTANISETVTYNGTIYSVTSIGEHAFYRCISLTSVAIPNSVTSIGEYAFNCCSKLTSINIPNNVTSIGESTFSKCSSLPSITIPNSVTTIGHTAFAYCSSLTTVICKAVLLPRTEEDIFKDVPTSSAVLYVPDEAVDIYKYMDPWDKFGIILPISQLPSAVENVLIFNDKDVSKKKVIRNGQVVVLYNDKSYTIIGQETR